MCKASVVAKKVTNAQQGQHLDISKSAHGLGAFHAKGSSVAECVACVKDGTALTLHNIPLALQKTLGVGPMEVVNFKDTGDNHHDIIEFKNGAKAPLIDFADKQIGAYVGVLELPNVSDETPASASARDTELVTVR